MHTKNCIDFYANLAKRAKGIKNIIRWNNLESVLPIFVLFFQSPPLLSFQNEIVLLFNLPGKRYIRHAGNW